MEPATLRVLIVDDSPEDRLTFRRFLSRLTPDAYTITEADRGDRALAVFPIARPDCVLLDYRLPDTDGLTVLDALRRQSDVPVVMLTGVGSEALAVDALQRGAQDYLVKGAITPERLALTIQRAVETARLTREHDRTQAVLTTVLDTLPVGVAVLDDDLRFRQCNPALARILAQPPTAIPSTTLAAFWPQLGAALAPLCAQALRGDPFRDLELHLPSTAEHDVCWLAVSGTPLDTPGEDAPLLLLTVQDTTARHQAEAARYTSEARFRALIELGTEGMALLTADGQLRYVSPGLTTLLGYALETTPTLNLHTLCHPDDQPQMAAFLTAMTARAGVTAQVMTRLRRQDGSWRWIAQRGCDQTNFAALGALIVSFHDVTTLVQAEQAAQAATARLQILATAARAFAEVTTDEPALLHRIAHLSMESLSAACAIWRLSADSQWLHAGFICDRDPAVQERLQAVYSGALPIDAPHPVATVARQGQPLYLPVIDPEAMRLAFTPEQWSAFEQVRPQSTIIVPLQARGAPLGCLAITRHEEGQLAFTTDDLTLAQDLADRAALALTNVRFYQQVQAAQQIAAEALARLDALIRSVPSGIGYLDRDLRYQLVNPALATINHRTPEEHLGHTPQEILPGLAPRLEPVMRQVLATGEAVRDLELHGQFCAAIGGPHDWLISYFPVRDVEGAVTGVGVTVTDVTASKRTAAALRDTERKLGALFALLPVGVSILDAQGDVVYANPALTDMLQVSADDLGCGKHRARTYLHADRTPMTPEDYASTQALRAGQAVHGVETGIITETGAEIWTSVSAAPVDIADWRLVIVTVDITARKQAEATLHQQAAMLDHAHILVRDAASRIVVWNQGATRLYGWTAEEAIGRISHELFQTRFPTSHEQVHTELDATGRWEGELTHHRRDGRAIVVASLWLLFRDAAGAPMFILEVNNDITATKQAEAALRASQQQLQHLIDNTDGVLWSMDADFRLLVGNQRFHEQVRAVTGRDIAPGESLLLPSLPAELLAERRQLYRRALAGETFTTERLSRVAVPPRTLEEHYSPMRTPDGTVTGIVVYMRDVTEARRVAQERQDLERKLAAVLDLLPVGIAILDADGAVVYMNPAQRRIVRLDEEHLPSPWQADRQYLRPDGTVRPLEEFAIIRALREQQPAADVETGIVTEAGEQIWTRASATPVDLAGWRVVAVLQDVTEQYQAHQTLQRERAQLAAILHTMHEGVIAVQPDGQIALINTAAARMRGLNPDRLPTQLTEFAQTGHQLFDVHGRAIPLAELPLPRVLRGERFADMELCQRGPDGQEQWRLVNGTPVPDSRASPIVGVITFRDITERKHAAAALAAHAEALSRTNAELTRALTLKDEFLAMITHELRTPLNVVLGYTEALAEEAYGPVSARQQHVLAQISRSGQHLLGILNDILDLTGMTAGRVRLTPELLDVDIVCRAALQLVEQRAREQGITLLRSVAVGVEGVRADSRRLTQILVNLLDNAVKFTPTGGTVGLEVTADETQEQIRFAVWDTGIGIAERDMGRLFQPFTQVDGRLARAYEGVGLGLTLVRRLVELHGGSVTLTSAPGQGSRFMVTLPWTPADNERSPAPEPTRTLQSPTWVRPPHVLVVDDDEATVTLYADHLAGLGCVVTTARTGHEALARVRERQPDIMVLDIQLPELDGIGVLERLRAEPATAALPVLAVTALTMPGDRERALAAGATAYLAKPVSLRTLVETIGQIRRDDARSDP